MSELPTPEDWAWYTARLSSALRRALDAEREAAALRAELKAVYRRIRVEPDAPAPPPGRPVGSPRDPDGSW